MTNPDNIVRVRARNGGRASVYEANGWAQAFTSGLIEGNGVTQNTSADMNVLVGGSSSKPDVVLAENPAGYRIALDIVGKQAVAITAPASNKRISAIVAYTDDLSLSSSDNTVTGSPSSCGLIVVNGTASASPSDPTDNQIRTAITADGATGSQAAYCVVATILVSNDTTTITDSLITINNSTMSMSKAVTASNIDFATLPGNYSLSEVNTGYMWVDGSPIYRKTIEIDPMPNNTSKNVPHNITNIGTYVKIESIMVSSTGRSCWSTPYELVDSIAASETNIIVISNSNLSPYKGYVTLYYTKSS